MLRNRDLIYGCSERNRTFEICVAMIKVVTMATKTDYLNPVN